MGEEKKITNFQQMNVPRSIQSRAFKPSGRDTNEVMARSGSEQ